MLWITFVAFWDQMRILTPFFLFLFTFFNTCFSSLSLLFGWDFFCKYCEFSFFFLLILINVLNFCISLHLLFWSDFVVWVQQFFTFNQLKETKTLPQWNNAKKMWWFKFICLKNHFENLLVTLVHSKDLYLTSKCYWNSEMNLKKEKEREEGSKGYNNTPLLQCNMMPMGTKTDCLSD